MEALIITIIAGTLFWFDVVSAEVFIGIVAVGVAHMYLGAVLYFKFGYLKPYYHDFLGWHTPNDDPQWSDGCSIHAKCKYCGKEIMQDSQGNWFTFE